MRRRSKYEFDSSFEHGDSDASSICDCIYCSNGLAGCERQVRTFGQTGEKRRRQPHVADRRFIEHTLDLLEDD